MSIVAVHGPTMLGRISLPDADLTNLAGLIADATYGDGNWDAGAFNDGQYVLLDDASQATWDGTNWTEVN